MNPSLLPPPPSPIVASTRRLASPPMSLPVPPPISHIPHPLPLSQTHELMTIFLEGKQQDLVAFMKGNDAAALGVDADACERNIRMLTLCTLCAAESELGYAQIAEGLGVALEDVEEWIVLAINEGLVTAKLDQLRELVLVQKSAQRVFNETQWKSLSEQLHSWRNNVGQLMEQVEKARGSTVELLKNERLA